MISALRRDPPGCRAERAVHEPPDEEGRGPRQPTPEERLHADARQTAELEMGDPSIEDGEQRERLDPRGDRDGQGDPGQPERSDEQDRERAVDHDRGDRRDDRVTVSWRA